MRLLEFLPAWNTWLNMLPTVNAFAEVVADALLRACWQGTLLALVVTLVCRLRLTARVRYLLWLIVCAKFVLTLLVLDTAVPLPVLQRHHAATRWIARLNTPTGTKPMRTVRHVAAALPSDDSEAAPDRAVSVPRPAAHRVLSRKSIVLGVWLCGVIFWGVAPLAALRRLRRQLQGAVPADTDSAAALCANRVAARIGMRRPPRLLLCGEIAAPLVTRLFRPTIVLPAALEDSLTPAELEMALAHEMAHLRWRDLWLGVLPTVARALFFFLPVVHWAVRECAAACEEGCDAAALRLTDAAPGGYSRLLLKMVAAQNSSRHPGIGQPTSAALGMAALGYKMLKRRLRAMPGAVRTTRSRWQGRAVAVLCVPILTLLAPWRLTVLADSLAPALPSRPLPRYTITDLGTLGGNFSQAYAISDSGQVAGSANLPFRLRERSGRGHAVLWGSTDLQDLSQQSAYRHSTAYAVNRHGMAVASAFNRSGREYAFVWDGQRHYIGSLPGFRYSRALGINDRGQVVGVAQDGRTVNGVRPARAFLYERNHLRDLGTLGGSFSHALAINNHGEIVGKADTGSQQTHAFVLRQNEMRDLGTLAGGENSLAYAISDGGKVVGYSETGDGTLHAFSYADTMTDLGTLRGDRKSIAYGVSASGDVVGASESESGDARAVLWYTSRQPNGSPTVVDLNRRVVDTAGWRLEAARAINTRGQIVGQGTVNGHRHAFLLTPVR